MKSYMKIMCKKSFFKKYQFAFQYDKSFITRNLATFRETINELWYTPTANVSTAQKRQGNQIGM